MDLRRVRAGGWMVRAILSFVTFALPHGANALTLSEARSAVIPILYGTIGFFGGLSFLIFGTGFVIYIVRMACDYRMYGIDIMIWGVTVLFVVVLLIGLLVWIQ